MRKSIEISENLKKNIAPILEQQDKIKHIVESATMPKFEFSTTALDAVKEITENSVAKSIQDNINVTNAINITSKGIKSVIPNFRFESPTFKALDGWNKNITSNLIDGLNAFVRSSAMQEIQSVNSSLGKWLQTVDFSPLTSILENIRTIGFDYDCKEVNEVFLKAMFDAKWFPYAGWIADFGIVDEMFEILYTSRASKNRINRIDKLIFSYYDKDEINNLKRGWRQMNLPSYMKRILIQSIQAYHRREYALTVSALSTLWEGIIQEKVNDSSYRVSRKTRENLTRLIKENEFDKIFSSFCEEFIFYDCMNAEEVKTDVPGRHGIAHCWYNTYPNRKVALNAILFTDFLLGLKPLDKTEEKDNG